jgi:hypothetical protein
MSRLGFYCPQLYLKLWIDDLQVASSCIHIELCPFYIWSCHLQLTAELFPKVLILLSNHNNCRRPSIACLVCLLLFTRICFVRRLDAYFACYVFLTGCQVVLVGAHALF